MNPIPSIINPETQPWSCEAEQSVLGSILIDNEALGTVSSVITDASFWHQPHRLIFEAVRRLIRAGQPADVVTVFDALGSKAEEVGGLAYINALAQSVPSASNCRRYAEIVADKALRRDVLCAVDSAIDVVNDSTSADEALDAVQARLACWRRPKFDPPCRLNFDPGLGAGIG